MKTTASAMRRRALHTLLAKWQARAKRADAQGDCDAALTARRRIEALKGLLVAAGDRWVGWKGTAVRWEDD
jgi:hypothetical protein